MNGAMAPRALVTPQPSSILLRVTYEIRLAIYDLLPLPAINDTNETRDFQGFYYSCRQIKQEIEHEAARKLKRLFTHVEEKCNSSLENGGMFITHPSNLLQSRHIIIHIPFRFLDTNKPHGGNIHGTEKPEGCYSVFKPDLDVIWPLFKIRLSHIMIRLYLPKEAFDYLRQNIGYLTVISAPAHYPLGRLPLTSTLIGARLEEYIQAIDGICCASVYRCRLARVVYTTKVVLEWNFKEAGTCFYELNNIVLDHPIGQGPTVGWDLEWYSTDGLAGKFEIQWEQRFIKGKMRLRHSVYSQFQIRRLYDSGAYA